MNVLGPPCMELILHAVSLMFVCAMIQRDFITDQPFILIAIRRELDIHRCSLFDSIFFGTNNVQMFKECHSL